MGAFANFADFLHMGGYATFVWSCFALSAVVLIYNAVQPLKRHRELKREIRGQIKRQQNN